MKFTKHSKTGAPGSSDTLTQQTIATFSVRDEAIAAVKKARLPIPKRPTDAEGTPIVPKLPQELANATGMMLARLMSQYTGLADYAGYATALADIDLSTATHVYEHVLAKVRLQKTGSVQERTDKALTDPRVRSAARHYYSAEALAKLTNALSRSYERDLATVSREVTRRGQEEKRT